MLNKRYLDALFTVKNRVIAFFVSVSVLFTLSACFNQTSNNSESELLVFASASLRDAMQEVGRAFQQQYGTEITFNFAGSNVLARQIEASPRADIYLSANEQWVNYLSDKNLIELSSKRVFLSNNLVVVAPKESSWRLNHPSELANIPFDFLSLGDPNAVPAGRYAKQYLSSLKAHSGSLSKVALSNVLDAESSVKHADRENLNGQSVWSLVANRVLPAPDVRAAASVVASVPNLIGIVYKTDAMASNKLNILYEIDLTELKQQERVKYVAASVKKPVAHVRATDFLNFIMQAEAQRIFIAHGFDIIQNQLPAP